MATSMPAELHGLVIQALLCLNRLSSGSFGRDGSAQASSSGGRSDGAARAWPDLTPLHPGVPPAGAGHAQALGIQLGHGWAQGHPGTQRRQVTSAPCSGPSDCGGKKDVQNMEKGEVY